jgi:hypothetical protein
MAVPGALALGDLRKRSAISDAKLPLLRAIQAVLEDLRDYWPVSDRKIHYKLVELPDPPLIHASKPDSLYQNDRPCYKAVIDLLARGRLAGLIPWEAIGDETRPVVTWHVHADADAFIREQLDEFGEGYARDLQQSQPDHVEIVGEKLTVESIVRPVAMKYCLSYTIGRGYSSLSPRKAMLDRYKKSGKASLVILFLSDHDPEGWDIAETFARSMRDDFGVRDIRAFKVGLTPEQVERLGLPPNTSAKKSSSRYRRFKARFGPAAYELEAAEDARLGEWLEQGVRSVLDMPRLYAEVRAEKEDEATVAAFREASLDYLKHLRPE